MNTEDDTYLGQHYSRQYDFRDIQSWVVAYSCNVYSIFQIVGDKFDLDEKPSDKWFETIYALLDSHSPEYRKSFGDALFTKLSNLKLQQDEQETPEEKD